MVSLHVRVFAESMEMANLGLFGKLNHFEECVSVEKGGKGVGEWIRW